MKRLIINLTLAVGIVALYGTILFFGQDKLHREIKKEYYQKPTIKIKAKTKIINKIKGTEYTMLDELDNIVGTIFIEDIKYE